MSTATLNGRSESQCLTKADRYNWRQIAHEGRFERIDKHLLHVDAATYQRPLKASRVNRIAANWCWRACLCLGVARRSDGTFWVFDGQHRLMAAMKREEITHLPCLVFDVDEISSEAKAFDDTNNVRGPMRNIERFRARLVAKDKMALDTAALIELAGYEIAMGSGRGTLCCIKAIEQELAKDRDTAHVALMTCADIYDGKSIHGDVFRGIAYMHGLLKREGDRITRPDIVRKLKAAGPDEIMRSVNNARIYRGKSGERVFADGIAQLLNKGKRTKQVPSPFSS